MRPRVDFRRCLRWAAAGLKAGGAAFAAAVIVTSPDAVLVLGLLAISLLVVGGTTWTGRTQGRLPIRILVSLVTVILARVAFGTVAAALAAVLVALGAWLRVRVGEAVVGLAVFGIAIAFLGGASVRVAVAFWMIGLAILALRHLVARLWRAFSGRRSLTAEKGKPAPLAAES